MGFRTGIVGLPNVGKSTLFNALTRTAAAQAANFPFCTIEPNVGEVAVPEPRLARLAEIGKSAKVIPARMTFVDIAGLVRGASRGEGLGNQFLANIRECDAIAHVLRCFEDDDVTHVEGRVDPIADAETIETELMLADLESIERRQAGLVRRLKGNDKEAAEQAVLLERAKAALDAGRPARTVEVSAEERRAWDMLQLLTAKPVLYVCNVEEASAATGNAVSTRVEAMARAQGAGCVVISARIEEGDRTARRRGAGGVPRGDGPRGAGPRPADPRGLPAARAADLLHGRAEGGAGLDDPRRDAGAAGGGRDPRRLRARLHPRGNHRVRRFRRARGGAAGEGGGPHALGGQGVSGGRRRRHALPLQRMNRRTAGTVPP
jgi:hypothetical protein